MKNRVFFFLTIFSILLAQNPVYSDPEFATKQDSIVVYFDATLGDQGLMGYNGDVWAHAGVITENSTSPSDWRYVKTNWGQNTDDTQLELVSADLWKLTIGYPHEYYGCPNSEQILQLAFVFRNHDGSVTGRDVGGTDIYLDLYDPGITAIILEPAVSVNFTDPLRSPLFASTDDTVRISVSAVTLGTQLDSLKLFIGETQVSQAAADTLAYNYIASEYGAGAKEIAVVAIDSSGITDSAAFVIMVNPAITDISPPAGTVPGINYVDETTVTLALFAPYKDFVYVIGDLNDWKVDTTFFMKRHQPDADSTLWWLTIEGLIESTEYTFQYLVDGEIRIADPYTDKVLNAGDDPWIPEITYPDLMEYPVGKTQEPVAVLQTGQQPYDWVYSDTFTRPPQKDLIIYEMLVRDFIARHDYETLIDTLDYLENLGINAIELMPINEFEGNSSWGYNPSFYFAPDKYYGTKNALKAFIDECHRRGIMVIMDMVLNHSYGQSPLVRLYWDGQNGRPSAENPWYNTVSPNNVYSWGNDFNHESVHTEAFVDRVTSYWISEYKIDGYRFDFTKGFTNTSGDGGGYDAARIAILKRMADEIWAVDSTAYIILEHFAHNDEEEELAEYQQGMMLWGNSNYNYNEATMGWHDNEKSDFSWGYYVNRGWSKPNLVTYMESHDEERLMHKNLQWGNSSGSYDIQELGTALNRIKLANAFFLTLPGPKMIWQFGELGYDYSINYEDCRVCEKPIRWDYFAQEDRNKLYRTIAALTKLRNENEVFRSPQSYVNLWLNSNSGLKRIRLANTTMNVSIIGNFGVTTQSINPDFHHTSTWYDYFSGDSIIVDNTNQQISLSAGQFHIYTDQWIEPPEAGLLEISDDVLDLPVEFSLSQNYPNPFNPVTKINYSLPQGGLVTLAIFDLKGREVIKLVSGYSQPGIFQVEWNGKDRTGQPVASGMYIYRLKTTDQMVSRKLVLLR